MSYGLPYMGSKNSIAPKIISMLPKAKNFYDLFCGGCAITECAILSKKYENIYFNDLDGDVPQLFLDAVNGKLKNKKQWISREDFFRLKDTDVYVRLVWSFGNKGSAYLFSKELEPYKRAYWEAVVNDDFTYFWKLGINMPKIKARTSKEKRLLIRQELKKLGYDRLQSLQNLERLESLENNRLTLTKLSYEQVKIEPNSVVYCDIPYEGTAEYVVGAFNYKKFYDWACNQKELVVISSYDIKDERFQRVVNFKKYSNLQGGAGARKDEGLFIPKTQLELWKKLKENR